MADVSVDIAEVNRVAARLTTDSATIVTDLTALQAAVQALLSDPEGGLWLAQASPVLSANYIEFNKMLTDAINNITSFAQSFQSVADQLHDMDTSLANPAQ
jgi:hypothetical protein